MPEPAMHPIAFDPTLRGPLAGLRVLDMTRLIAGNMLSLQLADFGAEVVKVEALPHGDPLRAWGSRGVPTYWKTYCRNKKSLSVNLREQDGVDLLRRLCAGADVLIENMIPGRLEQMGLNPEALMAENPRLVIVRISGFGQTGPYREKPGFGTLIEAMSGFAARNGFPDREPLVPPMALADMMAGLSGAFATLAALRERDASGRGQVLDLSLLEPLVTALGAESADYAVSKQVKPRVGNGSNTSAPRNVYPTADGNWVALSASIQSMAERVFAVVGCPELVADPRFATNADRVAHREEVDSIVGGWVAQRTLDEALRLFGEAGVTAGPVYDIAQFLQDEHVIEREVVVEVPDADVGGLPMQNVNPRLSRTPGGFRYPAPALGQHNDELLGGLGINADGLAALRARGVIG
ncbi:MAG: CoA transferase [Chloroflexota bacterium]